MKRYKQFLGLSIATIVVAVTTAFILPPVPEVKTTHQPAPLPLRRLKNDAFKEGEKMTFRIHYGWFTAGEAVLEIKPGKHYAVGRDCYRIEGRGKTASAFEWFFKVDDKFLTYMDKDALLPWWYIREINEGNFHHVDSATFYHDRNKVSCRKGILDIPANTMDMLSAFYYLRCTDARNAPLGTTIRFPTFMDDKVYDLGLKIVKREVIDTEFGKLKTIKVAPLVVAERVFKGEESMYVWVTDDRNLLPVRIETPLVVGSIAVDLVKYEGLRHPMTAKVED